MPRARVTQQDNYKKYELDGELGSVSVRDGRYAILPVLTVVTEIVKREWVIYDMQLGLLESEGVRFQNLAQAKSYLATIHPQ